MKWSKRESYFWVLQTLVRCENEWLKREIKSLTHGRLDLSSSSFLAFSYLRNNMKCLSTDVSLLGNKCKMVTERSIHLSTTKPHTSTHHWYNGMHRIWIHLLVALTVVSKIFPFIWVPRASKCQTWKKRTHDMIYKDPHSPWLLKQIK